MRALLHLNKYFWKYKYHFSLGLLFITISNIFAIYPAALIRQALDLVIENLATFRMFEGFGPHAAAYRSLMTTLLVFCVIIISMALLKGLFMFFMRQTIIVMSRLVEYDMKNEIYEHYQKLDLAFYKMNSTGDLMNRISEDVGRVRMYVGPAIMYTINLVVLFILLLYTMLSVNVKLTIFVLMPLPVLSVAVYFVNSTILKKSEKVQQQLSRVSSFVQETFAGIRIIKAYNRLNYYASAFDRDAESYREKNVELVRFNAFFFPLIMLLIGLSTLLTVYVGGIEVANGKITSGVIAEFIIYVNMLTWPVASIGWVTSMMQRAAASQKRINEFMKEEPRIFNTATSEKEIRGQIEFRNVSFTYPDSGLHVLKGISFRIDPGKTLAILGATGSGKTTIAQLINRLYEADSGEVLLDGTDIRRQHLSQLRRETGYVPQEVFLFSDTIRNNIAFGLQQSAYDSAALDALVAQAAKDADIYENIIAFPEGFDTKVGERGLTLSGGQKQRVSIARAIIKTPKILVFDDCLSAVDTETEENILQNLLRIMHGRTTVLISHRISTIKSADHILVLEDGIIGEEGTHAQLLEKRGAYFGIYEKQLRTEKPVKE